MAGSLVFNVSAVDRASQAFERIANKVDMLVARLSALGGMSANPRLDVDTDPADRTLGRWAMEFKRKTREALANIPKVDITVGSDAAQVEIQRIRQEISTLLDKKIDIDISAEDAVAEIERLRNELKALDVSGADIRVKADVAGALADLEAVLAAARRVDDTEATVDVQVDKKGFKDVLNAMALFSRSLTQLARGPGLIIAIPGIVSLLESLTDLLGLLGLVPGLAAGAIAAVAALAVGFKGVGDAITEADPTKFAEALAKLAPNAQTAVLAIRGLADEWNRVQQATQNALFAGVSQSIEKLGTMLPTIQAGLQGIAAAFAAAFNNWAQWASQVGPTQQLAVIFENVRAAVALLGPGITFVAQALTDMAVVGARMLPDLAAGFTNAAKGFADFIADVTANGQFEAWIRGAFEVVQQLGDIVVNVWTGFQGLFDAVNTGGQTFLTTLVAWSEAFTNFTNSVEGAQALQQLFDAMRQMGAGVGPAIAAAFNVIGTAIVTMAPAVESVGKFFATFLDSLAGGVGILGTFASALAPAVDALTALLGIFDGVPAAAILGAFLVFRLAGTILAGFAGAVRVVIPLVEGLGLALIGLGSLSGIGGALAGVGAALGTVGAAMRGFAAFLIGPWGFAILAAIAVIGLLVGSSGDAEQAARDHQAAVESLSGSLNQYTGALTEATAQQIAQDLAATKLSDGTTSLATAVQAAGINFKDFAGAAAGNGVLLEKVNAQLVAQATQVIKNSDSWDKFAGQIERAKIPMEVVAAAALGNVGAMKELHDIYGLTTPTAERMTEAFAKSLGPLAEVGMILGSTTGALAEAQANTKLAAQATADWGQELANTAGALGQFKDALDPISGQIIPTAVGAGQLVEAFGQLGFAAEAAATNAGKAAEALNGLQAGGAAAAASAEASRKAFIDMATAAGVPVAAAERLADALGLIPAVQQLIFLTNATEAEGEIIRLVGQIQAMGSVPHEIRVDMLTDEAQAALEALGVKIVDLGDGQVLLKLDDSEFRATLEAALASGQTLPEIIAKLGLDITGAEQTLGQWQASLQDGALATPISFTTKLDTTGADQEYQAFVGRAAAPLPPLPLNLDTAGADAGLEGFRGRAQTEMVTPLNADPSMANAVLAALLAAVNGALGIMTIDGNNAPALDKIAAAVAAANAALGTMTIEGNNGPALAAIAQAVAAANNAKGTMTIDGNAGPAIAAARAAVNAINGMSASITITTTRKTINETVFVPNGRNASGGAMVRFARGGIVPGYAPGIDRVPALLSPGEGVLVPEAVRMLGARAVANLNKLASGGRRSAVISKTGHDAYMSFGARSGRSGGTGLNSGEPIVKNYYLTIQNAGNSEIDLREQFRRMEVLGV